MAVTAIRSCVFCNAPMITQRSTKQTCSERCTKAHYRAQQRQQATQPTIKTEGNNTMSTQTPMQFVFSETEYRSRCQNEKAFYESRIEKPFANILGAIVEFTPGTLVEALEVYHQHRAAGWTPLEPMAGLPTASLVESPHASFITLYLKKPERDQEKDLAKLCKQVRADYEMELATLLEAETERQVQMMLAKQDRDSQLAADQQRLEREQAVREELAVSRAKLREQLIESGKLNADGSAK